MYSKCSLQNILQFIQKNFISCVYFIFSSFGTIVTAILFPLAMFLNNCKVGPLIINTSVITAIGLIGVVVIIIEKFTKARAISKTRARHEKAEERLQTISSKYSSLCAQTRNLFKLELKELHGLLNLRNEDVITIYIQEDHILHQHTRFSPSIPYNKPSCHADSFGVLGKIWTEGEWFDNKFPITKKSDYLQYARLKYNMKDEKVHPISRIFSTYFGVSIVLDSYTFAVLLVESNITDIDPTEALKLVSEYAKRIEKYFTVFKKDADILAPFTGDNK